MNVQAIFDKELQEFADAYDKRKTAVQAAAADRAKRTSQLTMPPESYTGKYSNDYFGTIDVSNKSNALAVKMGNINCVSTAFKEPETIRVEMIPGSGEVIRFKKDAAGTIVSLSYAGVEFVRMK